jgi:hypothetical protein
MQPFDTLTIEQRDLDDCRHLPQQPQNVEPVPIVGTVPPRQLDGPLQLVGDVVQKPWTLPAVERVSACSRWLSTRLWSR